MADDYGGSGGIPCGVGGWDVEVCGDGDTIAIVVYPFGLEMGTGEGEEEREEVVVHLELGGMGVVEGKREILLMDEGCWSLIETILLYMGFSPLIDMDCFQLNVDYIAGCLGE